MNAATELSQKITAFLNGTAGDYEWDDAISGRGLKEIRQFRSDVQVLFPSGEPSLYTSAEGEAVLTRLAELLKESPDAAHEYVVAMQTRFST